MFRTGPSRSRTKRSSLRRGPDPFGARSERIGGCPERRTVMRALEQALTEVRQGRESSKADFADLTAKVRLDFDSFPLQRGHTFRPSHSQSHLPSNSLHHQGTPKERFRSTRGFALPLGFGLPTPPLERIGDATAPAWASRRGLGRCAAAWVWPLLMLGAAGSGGGRERAVCFNTKSTQMSWIF